MRSEKGFCRSADECGVDLQVIRTTGRVSTVYVPGVSVDHDTNMFDIL